MRLPFLDPHQPRFPDPESALADPNGLLAAGGNLAPATLLDAYRNGIFPWYSAGQPILWWSPDPRTVLRPDDLHVSRSLAKVLRRGGYEIRVDSAFNQVVEACAAPRGAGDGTWITPAMIAAYGRLHQLGHAHSVEYWLDGRLAGGLYGVVVNGVFCGESMFSRVANASKLVLVHLLHGLTSAGFALLDCQVDSAHLTSLGARPMARRQFINLLRTTGARNWPASDISSSMSSSIMAESHCRGRLRDPRRKP